MSRVILSFSIAFGMAFATIRAIAEEPLPPKVFVESALVVSNVQAVEFAAVQRMKNALNFLTREDSLDLPLDFALSLEPNFYIPAYDKDGKPSAALKVLAAHAGRSEASIVETLKAETRKASQQNLVGSLIRVLQVRIDQRNWATLRGEAADFRTSATRFHEDADRLRGEHRKFRDSAMMYRTFAALRHRSDLTDAERRTLTPLQKSLGHLTDADVTDFARFMETLQQSSLEQVRRQNMSGLQATVNAMLWDRKIKPLTPEEAKADASDRKDLAALLERSATLSKRVRIADLIGDTPAARSAFLSEWGAVQARRYTSSIFNGESEDGAMKIAAVTNSNYGLHIGADGVGTIILKGTRTVEVETPGITAYTQVEPDYRAMIVAFRDGREELIATTPVRDTAIRNTKPQYSSANVALQVGNGVTVDLRELNTRQIAITTAGTGRYLFSNQPDRTNMRMTIMPAGKTKSNTPAVLSVPAGIRLSEQQIHLGENHFTLRLDCMVSSHPDTDDTLNVDLELRGDGLSSRLIPLFRNGKCRFADGKSLLAKMDEVKTAMAVK